MKRMVMLSVVVAVIGTLLGIDHAAAFETGRDDQFIAYNDGTVLDTKTKLMWAGRDNGKDISLADAASYCRNYRAGGHSDWRMPTLDELASLYNKNKSYRSDCGEIHLTRLIRVSCDVVLASDKHAASGSYVAGLEFFGGTRMWLNQSTILFQRALPVRSAK